MSLIITLKIENSIWPDTRYFYHFPSREFELRTTKCLRKSVLCAMSRQKNSKLIGFNVSSAINGFIQNAPS